MPLMLQEKLHRASLLEMLRTGEIDCAILAEPFPRHRPGHRAAVRRAFHGRACPSTTRWPPPTSVSSEAS
jgi:hypothetical protein